MLRYVRDGVYSPSALNEQTAPAIVCYPTALQR
jgi:hypothetical protein